MTYKSGTQPLCRYCGAKIRKRTGYVTLWSNEMQARIDPSYEPAGPIRATAEQVLPQTREEAQRLVNAEIVSVSYRYVEGYDDRGKPFRGDRLGIEKVTTWDGESYEDEFFCGGHHAQAFGYLMARGGHCTTDYNDAVRAQQEKF